jgi:hypothetical protein
VHVLEHEHGRQRRRLELGEQQRLDLVRRRAPRERLGEQRRDAADEVPDRAERPRDREVVARAEQDAGGRAQPVEDPGDERRLPDSRLTGHEHDAAGAARRARVRLRERRERPVALEEVHGATLERPARR